ncbi:uncharacterized protein K02A2.6-like [Planococcus citri]|uniref:uncharacterized protein K02A2.6-like n=1 Tax=Planococcus citri TaxID=170843 RepID=UPI0031F8C331
MRIVIQESDSDEPRNRANSVRNGFPHYKSDLPQELHFAYNFQHELSEQNDVIFKDNRIFVPQTLREQYLSVVHNAHQGIQSCVRKARKSFYWPGMANDIKKYVSACETCCSTISAQPKTKMIHRQLPELPFSEVAVDFMHVGKDLYLVLVDIFSKYIELRKLPSNSTADQVIRVLKTIFYTHGLPQKLYSDNGPPFTSTTFLKFLESISCTPVTSSPLYSQSNGQVERAIQTAKSLITKARKDNRDEGLAILEYNTTDKESTSAPSTMLMGRYLRTNIPIHNDLLRPNYSTSAHSDKLNEQQQRSSQQYSKSTKAAPSFVLKQPVWIKIAHRHWEKAIVTVIHPHDSYTVCTNDNRTFRRNVKWLRPRISSNSNTFCPELDIDIEDSVDTVAAEQNSAAKASPHSSPSPILNPPVDKSKIVTRSGRSVKKPEKLNL